MLYYNIYIYMFVERLLTRYLGKRRKYKEKKIHDKIRH